MWRSGLMRLMEHSQINMMRTLLVGESGANGFVVSTTIILTAKTGMVVHENNLIVTELEALINENLAQNESDWASLLTVSWKVILKCLKVMGGIETQENWVHMNGNQAMVGGVCLLVSSCWNAMRRHYFRSESWLGTKFEPITYL